MKRYAGSLGAAILSDSTNASAPPTQYLLEIDATLLPTVSASFEGQTLTNLNLESNSKYIQAFSETCKQELSGHNSWCASAPTNVDAQLNASLLTGVGSTYDSHSQGGFETAGRIVFGDLALMCANSTLSTAVQNPIYTAEEIIEDAWNLNM